MENLEAEMGLKIRQWSFPWNSFLIRAYPRDNPAFSLTTNNRGNNQLSAAICAPLRIKT